jgi:iron complex outermembrane receptor protein
MIKNINNKHSRLEFRKSKLAGIISTIYVVLSSGTVLAQDSITKAVKHVGLERIEVTAQKRVQSIQDIPIAITAFSGDMIEDMGLNTSSDLANKTPNLTIGQPTGEGGVVAVVIRGVGLSDFAPNNQAPIGLYVDGVVAGNSNAQITTLMDVERVEVLKGPQGTLYGRNTTGGTINVISRKPTADTEGYLRINAGNYGMRKIEGVFNTSLSDDLNIRLAVSDYHLDGYMENIVTGNEIEKNNTAYRLLVDWNVNNKWSVLFNLHGNNNDSDADLYNADSDSDFYKSSSAFDPKISTKTLGGSITINGELTDKISFTSITAYDDLDKVHQEDADVSALDLVTVQYKPKSKTFAQEFHLNGTYDNGHWIVGTFYSTDDIDYDQSVRLYGDAELVFGQDLDGNGVLEPYAVNQLPGFSWQFQNTQALTTAAIFGQVDHKIQDNIEITVGLRATKEKVTLTSYAELAGIGLVLPAELGGFGLPAESVPDLILPGYYAAVGSNENVDANGIYSEKIDDTNLSGKIGISWRASDELMLFANYNHGFKGGGLNGNFIFNPEALSSYGAETVESFDLGFKSDLFNNALRLNSTFFYYDYQDSQIFNNINDPHYGLPAQRIINGDVSLYGFDGEFSWMATDSLSIIGSVGYVKSKYDESPIDPVVGELAIKGNQIQNAPEFSANIMANYEWELSDGGYVNANVDVSYTDKTYFSPFEDDDISMGSYAISNLRVSWTNESEVIEIAFWGKNLADKEVKTYAFDLRDVAGVIENMRGAPRTFGVELTYNFM